MKSIVFLVGLVVFLFSGVSYARWPVQAEGGMTGVGTAVTTSISTTSWTEIHATPTAGRMGIAVTNDDDNTSNMYGVVTSAATPAEATTVQVYVFRPGITGQIKVIDTLNVFLLYGGTSAANVHSQEFQQ